MTRSDADIRADLITAGRMPATDGQSDRYAAVHRLVSDVETLLSERDDLRTKLDNAGRALAVMQGHEIRADQAEEHLASCERHNEVLSSRIRELQASLDGLRTSALDWAAEAAKAKEDKQEVLAEALRLKNERANLSMTAKNIAMDLRANGVASNKKADQFALRLEEAAHWKASS